MAPNPADAAAINPAADRLWRFVGYYGLSEVASRATRLATTVLLARLLTPVDLGVAASAITCFELLRVAANAGAGQAVIRASETRLAGTCVTAHRIMWGLCGALAALQTAVGVALAMWTGRPELAAMVAVLAGVYLMMPAALIQTYLVQRASRHGRIATVATAQAVADNMLTIVLALAGFGAWAIVLPKVLTCPIWVLGMRRAQPWRPDRAAGPVPAREVWTYGLPVLGAELATAARLQLDKVIVGAMLGVEALGVYYFVFNAGIGLSLSLTSAVSNALYPHFAAVAGNPRRLLQRFDRGVWRTTLPVAGLIVLQALLAPLYVPLVFGAKWSATAWLVAVLCASAATKLLADAGAQALRAAGATMVELRGMLAITVLSLVALALGLVSGLAAGVVALALTSAIAQLGFAVAARRSIADAARLSADAVPQRIARSPAVLTITHLIDDAAVGGVTRFLDALEPALGAAMAQTRMVVVPRATLPPTLSDDVVVVHFTMSWAKLPYLLALRVRRGRRPIVLVEHSYTAAFERNFVAHPRRFRAMLRTAYRLADGVVPVSYGQAAWLRQARVLPAAKLAVIAPFTASEGLSALPLPVAHQGPLRLGAYGRYCAQKDFSSLIAAMGHVDPAVARLYVRGFGPDADRLQAAAAAWPHVEIGTRVDDLAGFLGGVDAVVVPSCFEPFGQVALEARLAGRPIIVTDVDGLPEQVEPGSGLIVPPQDPVALAAAITTLAAAHRAGTLSDMGGVARAGALGHVAVGTRRWQVLLVALAAAQMPAQRDGRALAEADLSGTAGAGSGFQPARS